jgi:hypothetical protein
VWIIELKMQAPRGPREVEVAGWELVAETQLWLLWQVQVCSLWFHDRGHTWDVLGTQEACA